MKLFEILTRRKYSLHVDDELTFDDRKTGTLESFIDFCCDNLNITDTFTCNIVCDRDSHGIKTTAFYNPSEKSIAVYGKNRMLGDIARSVAHEMIHHLQNQEQRIEYPVQDVGGEIEDEANARAGQLVKLFINKHDLGSNLFEQRIY